MRSRRVATRTATGLASSAVLATLMASGGLARANATLDQTPSQRVTPWQLGRSLFDGPAELQGRIYTHVVDLPPTVVRCANCHALHDGPDVPRSLAPRLTHDGLLSPHARRGGPATTYSRDTFCTLLRRGIDPAFVLISVEMPRYQLDATACDALWRYVIGSPHADDAH